MVERYASTAARHCVLSLSASSSYYKRIERRTGARKTSPSSDRTNLGLFRRLKLVPQFSELCSGILPLDDGGLDLGALLVAKEKVLFDGRRLVVSATILQTLAANSPARACTHRSHRLLWFIRVLFLLCASLLACKFCGWGCGFASRGGRVAHGGHRTCSRSCSPSYLAAVIVGFERLRELLERERRLAQRQADAVHFASDGLGSSSSSVVTACNCVRSTAWILNP